MTGIQPCRSCQAPTFFALGPRGNRMIFDAEPVEATSIRGLWVLTGEDTARAAKSDDTGPFFASHHATCPHAAQWRRRKAKAG